MRVVVVKVGGSVLTLPDLATRLDRLLQSVSEGTGACPLLVCGGGEAADIVRTWSELHRLDAERSHWLALRAMMLNESLLLDVLPNSAWVSSVAEIQAAWHARQIPVLQTLAFLRHAEPSSPWELPHTWEATSDSVAAWVAAHLKADELVLAKSADLPLACTVKRAVRDALVDPAFCRYISALPRVRWTNLRSDDPFVRTWLREGRELDGSALRFG